MEGVEFEDGVLTLTVMTPKGVRERRFRLHKLPLGETFWEPEAETHEFDVMLPETGELVTVRACHVRQTAGQTELTDEAGKVVASGCFPYVVRKDAVVTEHESATRPAPKSQPPTFGKTGREGGF